MMPNQVFTCLPTEMLMLEVGGRGQFLWTPLGLRVEQALMDIQFLYYKWLVGSFASPKTLIQY